jgi:hypothetical protein
MALLTLEVLVASTIIFLASYGLLSIYDETIFNNEYSRITFKVSSGEPSISREYVRSPWKWPCQDARKYLRCDELIDYQRIGSCHIPDQEKCHGSHYWIDDIGCQHEDCYDDNNTYNYYPRYQVLMVRRWNMMIKLISPSYNFTIHEYCDYECYLRWKKFLKKNQTHRFVDSQGNLQEEDFGRTPSYLTFLSEVGTWSCVYLFILWMLFR